MFQECKMISKYLTLPCIHLTHLTPLPRSRFCRMRWGLRHGDVGESVGATDFSVPLCRDIFLPHLCRVAACGVCRMRVGLCRWIWQHLTLSKALIANELQRISVRCKILGK